MSQLRDNITVDGNNAIEEGTLRKKIKLEHHTICEKLQQNLDININEYKIQKFLLIFQELIILSNTEKATENQDSVGNVTSTLVTLA